MKMMSEEAESSRCRIHSRDRMLLRAETRLKMGYGVGVLLAVAVVLFAKVIGLDRDRAFYPTVLMVVASYYILFAAMGGSGRALITEIAVALGFSLVAAVGFKRNLRYVAAGLIGHGLFDFVHHRYVANAGVPGWWPAFCLAFDVTAGVWLALSLR